MEVKFKETKDLANTFAKFLIEAQLTEGSSQQPTQAFKEQFWILRKTSPNINRDQAVQYTADDVYHDFMEHLTLFVSPKRLHLINQLIMQLEGVESDAFRSTSGFVRYFIRFELQGYWEEKIQSEKDISLLLLIRSKAVLQALEGLKPTDLKNSFVTILQRSFKITKSAAEIEILYASLQKHKNSIKIDFPIKSVFDDPKYAWNCYFFLPKIFFILEGIRSLLQHAVKESNHKTLLIVSPTFFKAADSKDLDIEDLSFKDELQNLYDELDHIKSLAEDTVLQLDNGLGELISILDDIDPYLNAIIEKITIDNDPCKHAATTALTYLTCKRKEFDLNGIKPNSKIENSENSATAPSAAATTAEDGKVKKTKFWRKSLHSKIKTVKEKVADVKNKVNQARTGLLKSITTRDKQNKQDKEEETASIMSKPAKK
jgi:hypothetical protein